MAELPTMNEASIMCIFQEESLKGRGVSFSANFMLPVGWNAHGRAGAQAAMLDQEVIVHVLRKAKQQGRSFCP